MILNRIPTLLFLAFSFLMNTSHGSQLVSSSKSRLPMSLSAVISDLEAEGASEITRACVVTSRSSTRAERGSLLQSIFGLEESDLTAFGTKSDSSEIGLAVANPGPHASAADVASTVVACGGTVVFYPSPIDLARGEGLFDTLAPAIERLLAAKIPTNLIVVSSDVAAAQEQLQQAAGTVLPNLVQPRGSSPAQSLHDVFSHVEYVSSPSEVVSKLGGVAGCEPSEAAAAIASTVDFFAPASMPSLSGKDLAAARKFGPAARSALESAVSGVQSMVATTPLISNFGDLCDAAVKRAMNDLEASDITSPVAQQIKSQLQDELYSEMSDFFEDQLAILQDAVFDSFRKNLSQLRVSPNLAQDMDNVVQQATAEFDKASKKLIAKGSKTWSSASAKMLFRAKLKEFCTERLLVAKASGQYKPIPRKGVTVGLHWLLPKPFGNDFRQEPWMAHATDNMVYIPQDKITNVAHGDVKSGDWRSKIVPSPSSREMVYLQ